jgi:phenylacetate-CoA ligase
MVKVKGVNIFPSQIEALLSQVEGASSEYRLLIAHIEGRDVCTLCVECKDGFNRGSVAGEIGKKFKTQIGIGIEVELAVLGGLPRSEKKTARIIDHR